MNRYQIEALLDRYLKGETTAEESLLIEQWLDEHLQEHSFWEQLDAPGRVEWLDETFDGIKNTISRQAKVAVLPRRKLWRNIAAVAAVLLVCCSLYLAGPVMRSHSSTQDLLTLTVPAQQKRLITLADGSKVWLNGGSELRYPKAFEGRAREVYLSGEAYFDIQHNPGQAFLIHTDKVLTTVLGTAFNIREDKARHTIEVTVTRGKVSVAGDGKLLGVLTPNRQLRLDLLDNKVLQSAVDIRPVIAWRNSDLLFDDITFGEAAEQLADRYQVRISFAREQLKHCRFSGTAVKGEKLEKILRVMCAFNNATWKPGPDGSIVIDGPGCN